MCKYVAIAVIVAVFLLMAGAALLVQAYGWNGFWVCCGSTFVLAAIGWMALPRLFAYMMTFPIRQHAREMRGTLLTVHSVVPCRAPEFLDDDDEKDEEAPRGWQAIADRTVDGHDEEADEGPAEVGDWYQIDLTVTPPSPPPVAGQPVRALGWMPSNIEIQELDAAGRVPPDQLGWDEVAIDYWDGLDWQEGEAEVFGEQRLRIQTSVGRETRSVALIYAHFTRLGEVRLPRIDVIPGPEP